MYLILRTVLTKAQNKLASVMQKTFLHMVMGDWEGDTVIGKNHKGGLVTLAECKPRYVLAGHIRSNMPRV